MTQPIFPKNCTSLLSKHLSTEVFEALKNKTTANGFTLERAIRSGVENLDSGIGIYAGDEESYALFAPLFNPIIEEYHGFTQADKHVSDLNYETLHLPNLDPEEAFILSTRIRVGRNLENFPLGTIISKEQRNEVERLVVNALAVLTEELEGEYYPLYDMSSEVQQQLIKDHFLFKEGDRFFSVSRA